MKKYMHNNFPMLMLGICTVLFHIHWTSSMELSERCSLLYQTTICDSYRDSKSLAGEDDWEALYKKNKSLIDSLILSAQALKKSLEKQHDYLKNPKDFLFGLSSSAYQMEGGLDTNNSSAQFYLQKKLPVAGNAIDFWNRYKSDIQQMKTELGINSFRLSIAWERVQPTQNDWDEAAINHYIDIVKTLKKNGLEPIVVLHHYTIPVWFANLGGFEKTENSTYFVEFAKKIYAALYQDVTYWSTFNAPEAYAIKGYLRGEAAPGKQNQQLAAQVIAHILDAHVLVYQAIKGKNGLYEKYSAMITDFYPPINAPSYNRAPITTNGSFPVPRIGIQKNITLLDPSAGLSAPLNRMCCSFANMLQNEGFYTFFTAGKYKVSIPGVNVLEINDKAPQSIDWIGLNYYSNIQLFLKWPQKETVTEKQTLNPTYRYYPEGISRAVKELYTRLARPLRIPIIITENGIATANNRTGTLKRKQFFMFTLFTVAKLIEQGYPIIGYLPWSSHDCYEWPTEENKELLGMRRYGFFSVDFDTQVRVLKKSSYYYRDFLKSFFQ